jgi:hypothetical protein
MFRAIAGASFARLKALRGHGGKPLRLATAHFLLADK